VVGRKEATARKWLMAINTTPTESRIEGVDRRNLKLTNLSTHYKSGLALELNPSPKERENKSTKK
jgi:hypothetical protein